MRRLGGHKLHYTLSEHHQLHEDALVDVDVESGVGPGGVGHLGVSVRRVDRGVRRLDRGVRRIGRWRGRPVRERKGRSVRWEGNV